LIFCFYLFSAPNVWQLFDIGRRFYGAWPAFLAKRDVMRVLVWAGLLLALTLICSVTGLARMIGMPIDPLLWGTILMLAVLVGGLGIALIARPEPRFVPIRVAA
jgi:hypothetical protein